MFPILSETISSDLTMGTPEAIKELKFLTKRAQFVFFMRGPITGIFRKIVSAASLPVLVFRAVATKIIKEIKIKGNKYQNCAKKFPSPITNLVVIGSSIFNSSKV